MIAAFAAGNVGGRMNSGPAIDRFPGHRVAALILGLPALGLA
jgi:hypothetical protein